MMDIVDSVFLYSLLLLGISLAAIHDHNEWSAITIANNMGWTGMEYFWGDV